MKTAVEWLFEKINMFCLFTDGIPDEWLEALEQAKEMEKQQMFECWETAHQAGRFEGKGIAVENWQTFEQYYNQEYGNETTQELE